MSGFFCRSVYIPRLVIRFRNLSVYDKFLHDETSFDARLSYAHPENVLGGGGGG